MNSFTSISDETNVHGKVESSVMASYLRHFSLFILCIFIVVVAGSYWVDPYGVWQTNDSFPRKVAASEKVRQIKSYQSLQYSPEILIVGNSRVEIGMPQKHPFFQGDVYNLGIPGSSVVMQYDYAWHLIQTQNKVRQVLLAVDFVDFLSAKPAHTNLDGDWQARLNYFLSKPHQNNRNIWVQSQEQLQLLFSQSAIFDSFKTVVSQSQDLNAIFINGFNDGRLYHSIVRNEGFGSLYNQKVNEIQNSLQRPGLRFKSVGREFIALETFLQLLQTKGIAVTLFINPYQYQYLDLIEQNGLQESFLDWKTKIQQAASQHQIPLYDFAIRSNLVNAPAILESRRLQDNPYFWEPSHYRQAFGKVMLDAMQEKNCTIKVMASSSTVCNLTMP